MQRMYQEFFDLSSTDITCFDDGNYTYELHNQNGTLMIGVRSMHPTIRKAKPIKIMVPDTIEYNINLQRCFYDHRHLNDISALESFDTSHVTNMSEMFYNCRKLKDCIALSSWNVSNVTNMTEMFYNCYKLRDYNALSSWDVSKVMDMSGMFHRTIYLDDDLRPLSNWKVHEQCVLSGFRSHGLGFYQRDMDSPIINSIGWIHRNLYPVEVARIQKTSPHWLLDRDAAQRNQRT